MYIGTRAAKCNEVSFKFHVKKTFGYKSNVTETFQVTLLFKRFTSSLCETFSQRFCLRDLFANSINISVSLLLTLTTLLSHSVIKTICLKRFCNIFSETVMQLGKKTDIFIRKKVLKKNILFVRFNRLLNREHNFKFYDLKIKIHK